MSLKTQKHTNTENPAPLVVESLDAAASLTAYTRAQLQEWKRMGCPAFKPGNRIHLNEIDLWLADNPKAGRQSESVMTAGQIETRGHLLKQANDLQKLSERRKQFAKGEDVRRSVVKSWLAMKVKLHNMSVKLAQPLSLLNDPREVQRMIDGEVCAALKLISENEWFDQAEVARWLAEQPEILKQANALAK